MKSFIIILAMCLGLASAIEQTKLSEEDLQQLSKYLDSKEKEQIKKAGEYVPVQLAKARQKCFRDTDCPNSHFCIDMPSVLFDVLKSQRSLSAFEYVRESFGIESGECIVDLNEWLVHNATNVVPRLEGTLENINEFVNKSMGEQNLSGMKFFSKVEYDPMIRAPVARSTESHPEDGFSSALMFYYLFQGIGGDDDDDDDEEDGGEMDMLTYFLILPQLTNGNAGQGANMLSNPMLLFALLGKGGDSDAILPFILFSSVFGQDMSSIMPLILLSSLGDDGKGISDIIPLLALTSNGLLGGAGGSGSLANILPLLLLSGNDDEEEGDSSKTLLLFALMAGGQSCMDETILPLLLLLSQDDSDDDDDDADDDDEDSNDLLFIIVLMSFLTGGKEGDMNSILPLLLVNGGSLGGGDMDFGMIVILMSLGNMGQDGISGILPLLLLGNDEEDINIEDILLISVLGSGGMGGQSGDVMNLMLPLLLAGDGLGGDSMLPVLLLLFSSGQTGNGCLAQERPGAYPAVVAGHNQYSHGPQYQQPPVYAEEGFNSGIYMILMLTMLGDDEDMDMETILMLFFITGIGGGNLF